MKKGKLIGLGNTAKIYEWGENSVIKLFNEGYPKDAIEKEFYNAIAVRDMDFAKAKVDEIIVYGNSVGIIYDKIHGESLLEWLMKTGDLDKCSQYMSDLHKSIIHNSTKSVPNYKDFLRNNILNAESISSVEKEEGLRLLAQLPEGDVLCHGDFHPGNIIISNGTPIVIDFMNVCFGDFLYDIARTVFLIQYTPVPKGSDNIDELLYFKRVLVELYLKQMNFTREIIEPYLAVIKIARKGECLGEGLCKNLL